MSDYKSSVLNKFGTGAVEFPFDTLRLKEKETLPDGMAGEKVHIRKLSGAAIEDFADRFSGGAEKADEADKPDITSEEVLKSDKYKGVRADLVSRCLCDPEGELLFSDDADGCNEAINNEALMYLFRACQQVNGLGAKALEEAEKNS